MRFTNPPPILCRSHLHFGRWPCPWPGCPKGITEDEITEENITVYRERWTSFDGDEYFSWREPGVPFYESVNQLTNRELQRRLHPSDHPTVYHYTTSNALQCILANRAIWLTDYAYLNDSTELKYGLRLAKEHLEELLRDSAYSESRPIFESWVEALRCEPDDRIFLACFSMDGDSLSQWRSYGGIALGIRTESGWLFGYFKNIRALGYFWDKVLYEPAEQLLALRIYAHHTHQALSKDLEEQGERIRGYYESVRGLYRYAAICKAKAFEDEKEARVVVSHDSESPAPAKLQFRPAGNVLVPYVVSSDLMEQVPDHLPVYEIVVGPQHNQDLVQRSIVGYLAELGYPETVIVRKSRIPFRQMTLK
jgi:hypothetical protein